MRPRLLCLFSIALGCKPVEPVRSPAAPPSASQDPHAQPSPKGQAPVVLPGPCVNPDEDFVERMRALEPAVVESQAYANMDHPGDYDGDGTRDRVIVGGIGNGYGFVYIMRGSCGHFVGDLGSVVNQLPNAPWHHGLVDLRTSEAIACEGASGCTCVPSEDWYRFDGTAYQRDAAASRASSCDGDSGSMK